MPNAIDGTSLMPMLRGEEVAPERQLFFQWHRGDDPELRRCAAVRDGRYKAVFTPGAQNRWPDRPSVALFDIIQDPYEQHDLAAEMPEKVAELTETHDDWYADVSRDGYEPPRIVLGETGGSEMLTRQDWRGPSASWGAKGIGCWEVNVTAAARFEVRLRFAPLDTDGEATFSCGNVAVRQAIRAGEADCVFRDVPLPSGPGRLEAVIKEGEELSGVQYVEVKRMD